MDRDEQTRIEQSLTLIMKDAENDARQVPLANLAHYVVIRLGEVCAQIHALAAVCRQLLDAVPIDDDPEGHFSFGGQIVDATAPSYDNYGKS